MDQYERAAERAAERAERAAHRAARRAEWAARRHYHDRRGHPFWGLLLIAAGAIFLLDNLDIVNARFVWRNLWPLLMVVWGGYHVARGPHTGSRIVGAVVMAFGGLLLADRLFGWRVDVWDVFWPVMLIVFGIHVFFNSRRLDARSWRGPDWNTPPSPPSSPTPPGGAPLDGPPPLPGEPGTDGTPPDAPPTSPPIDGRVDSSATFRETAILAGIERRNVSQAFRGGETTAIMGGIEIDLRQCRMAAGEAYLDVMVMMGGVELRIPGDWTVESRVTALLAGVDDRSQAPLTQGAPRLIVRGTVFLGGVEIKN